MNVMKLEELVRLIREAIATQGLLQKDIAAHCGMTPAMLSYALSGRSNMREERWRLACEYCGIDFDAVMGYAKQDNESRPAHKASLPEGGGSAIGADGGSSPAPSAITPPPAQRRTRRSNHG